MKKYFILAMLSLLCKPSFAQEGEFDVYPNGLIYSENTMGKLSYIVDSLNLKYKTCDLGQVYFSKFQTIGHIVNLKEGNLMAAKQDIEANMNYEDFVAKYPQVEVQENNLIVRYQYKDYDNSDIVKFSEVSLRNSYGFSLRFGSELEKYSGDDVPRWILKYSPKSEYGDASISAFFFPEKFQSQVIPENYARMIGYADCMIDTTANKLKEEAEYGWVSLPKNWQKLSPKKQEKLLEEMRETKVIGSCSMDNRPRLHAINIAMLSAETTNWEVFLRAHLDIMNDRFDRTTDGSYAWAARKTYIKELEELEISVVDLILGISFRIENPSMNHYYGNISRIGRALSETQQPELIEKELLAIIENADLDHFNRILAYFLFDSYLYYLSEDKDIESKKAQLKNAIQTLPPFLAEKIKIE